MVQLKFFCSLNTKEKVSVNFGMKIVVLNEQQHDFQHYFCSKTVSFLSLCIMCCEGAV